MKKPTVKTMLSHLDPALVRRHVGLNQLFDHLPLTISIRLCLLPSSNPFAFKEDPPNVIDVEERWTERVRRLVQRTKDFEI